MTALRKPVEIPEPSPELVAIQDEIQRVIREEPDAGLRETLVARSVASARARAASAIRATVERGRIGE